MDFSETLSTFWFEEEILVEVYAAYALVACLVLSGFELRSQTSSAPYTKFLMKALALTIVDAALATLSMYVTAWQSRLLGGEIVAGVLVGAAWYAAVYFLNARLCRALGLSLARPRFYAHLPPVVLLLPCILLFALMIAMGSAYSI